MRDPGKPPQQFSGNEPVSQAAVEEFSMQAGFQLPDEYVRFLRRSNGGEGFIGNAYVILWRLEELLTLNAGYHVADYAPGLFLFGSDGGGEAFAFDRRTEAMPIVNVPFVGMALDVVEPSGKNFDFFLRRLSNS